MYKCGLAEPSTACSGLSDDGVDDGLRLFDDLQEPQLLAQVSS
jgi:hypothetical protein